MVYFSMVLKQFQGFLFLKKITLFKKLFSWYIKWLALSSRHFFLRGSFGVTIQILPLGC